MLNWHSDSISSVASQFHIYCNLEEILFNSWSAALDMENGDAAPLQ